jgi:Rod binding domain-containing protein
MHTSVPPPPSPLSGTVQRSSGHAELREKAKELEAAFLSEMLSHAGLSPEDSGFGGGIGEEQFSSFVRAEQARLLVKKGGIGLAETIFDALVKAEESKNAK